MIQLSPGGDGNGHRAPRTDLLFPFFFGVAFVARKGNPATYQPSSKSQVE